MYTHICKHSLEDMHELRAKMERITKYEREYPGAAPVETITVEEMLLYLVNRAMCKDSMKEHEWKEFHREVYGAMYPGEEEKIYLLRDEEKPVTVENRVNAIEDPLDVSELQMYIDEYKAAKKAKSADAIDVLKKVCVEAQDMLSELYHHTTSQEERDCIMSISLTKRH